MHDWIKLIQWKLVSVIRHLAVEAVETCKCDQALSWLVPVGLCDIFHITLIWSMVNAGSFI